MLKFNQNQWAVAFAVVALSFITSLPSFAQVSQGNLFLGGQVGFSSTSFEGNSDRKESTFSIIPNIGYMVSDNIAIGLGIGYNQARNENVAGPTRTVNTNSAFVVAPFARYYVPTSSDQFFFFAQLRADLGFGSAKTEATTGNVTVTTDAKVNTADVFVSPNFAFFPSQHWALEFGFRGLGFESVNPEGDNNNVSRFVFGVNSFAPRFAVQFFF